MRKGYTVFSIIVLLVSFLIVFNCSLFRSPEPEITGAVLFLYPDSLHCSPISFVFQVRDSNGIDSVLINCNNNKHAVFKNLANIDTISVDFTDNSFLDNIIQVFIYDSIGEYTVWDTTFTDTIAPKITVLNNSYKYFLPCTLLIEIEDNFFLNFLVNVTGNIVFIDSAVNHDTLEFIFTERAPDSIFYCYDINDNSRSATYSFGPVLEKMISYQGYYGDICTDGDYCYCVDIDYGIKIYDVSNLSLITTIPDTFSSYVWGHYLELKDSILYYAGGSIIAYDISDPASPKQITVHSSYRYITGFQIFGDYGIIATQDDGFRIFDLSVPEEINEISNFYIDVLNDFTGDFFVYKGYIYICVNDKIYIYDFANPYNPYCISQVNTDALNLEFIEVTDNILFAGTNEPARKLYGFNIDNPVSPYLSDTTSFPSVSRDMHIFSIYGCFLSNKYNFKYIAGKFSDIYYYNLDILGGEYGSCMLGNNRIITKKQNYLSILRLGDL